MRRNYYYTPTIINLFQSIPEDVTKAAEQDIDWGIEMSYNPFYWPLRHEVNGTDKGSTIITALRPGFCIDYRYGDGKIIVQSEEKIIYSHPNLPKDLLITSGDSFATDGINNTNTPSKIAETLDELFFGDNSEETKRNIERVLFRIPGVALQNTSWNRTIEGIKETYKKVLEGRVEASSERATMLSWGQTSPEDIYQAFYERYLGQGIEEFLAWGKEKGIDIEILKHEFMNLPFKAEKEVWDKLKIEFALVNLILRE